MGIFDRHVLICGGVLVPFSGLLEALSEGPDPRRPEGKRDPWAPLVACAGHRAGAAVRGDLGPPHHLLPAAAPDRPQRAVRLLSETGPLAQCVAHRAADRSPRRPGRGRSPARPGRAAAAGSRAEDGPCPPRQDSEAQLRPPQRPQGGPGAERLRLGAGDPAGAQRTRGQEDRDLRCPAEDRRVGPERRAVHRPFEAARDRGNPLLAQLKATQPSLRATLHAIAAEPPPAERFTSVAPTGHGRPDGRPDTRLVETFNVQGQLDAAWHGLIVSAARVARRTWHKDSKAGFWHATEEVSFYACQVALGAEAFGQAVRNHWGSEHRRHSVRDLTFGQDKSRTGIKPAQFARFRRFALNILRANGVENIARDLYVNALKVDNALAYHAS